jgi:Spy/CpxP family protein refolding chaperone
MKLISLVLPAALFLTAFSPAVAAEPKPDSPKSAEPETYVESCVRRYIEEIERSVRLSNSQKRAIGTIINARIDAIGEFAVKDGPKRLAAIESLLQARKDKDDNAIKKAEIACDESFAPERNAFWKSDDDLDAVLTSDQRRTVMEDRAKKCGDALITPAALSDEQRKKLNAFCAEIAKGGYDAIEYRLPPGVGAILTQEQHKEIFKYRVMGDVAAASHTYKLTKAQANRVNGIVDELAAAPRLKTDWPTFASERVRLRQRIDDILTVKQKKIVTASSSFSTSFLRPTWALKLGGPTVSAGGAMMPTKDRPTSPP